MNFYDVVTERGYSVKKLEDIIDISKEDKFYGHEPIGEIHIVFDMKQKEIMGYIKLLRNIRNLDDITHLYNSLFLVMQKDLKFFADNSKYAII